MRQGTLSYHATTSRLPLLMLLAPTIGVMFRNSQQCDLIRSESFTLLSLWQCVRCCHYCCGLHPAVDLKGGVLHFTRRGQRVRLISRYQVRCECVGQFLIRRMLCVVQAAWNSPSGVFVKKLQKKLAVMQGHAYSDFLSNLNEFWINQ